MHFILIYYDQIYIKKKPYFHSNACIAEKYICPRSPVPILEIYYTVTKTDKNMQSLVNCSITHKFMCALIHLNKGSHQHDSSGLSFHHILDASIILT
jgi:hypothetical protein